jgi:hypothetical protein
MTLKFMLIMNSIKNPKKKPRYLILMCVRPMGYYYSELHLMDNVKDKSILSPTHIPRNNSVNNPSGWGGTSFTFPIGFAVTEADSAKGVCFAIVLIKNLKTFGKRRADWLRIQSAFVSLFCGYKDYRQMSRLVFFNAKSAPKSKDAFIVVRIQLQDKKVYDFNT